jgi:hypothetical protein
MQQGYHALRCTKVAVKNSGRDEVNVVTKHRRKPDQTAYLIRDGLLVG